MSVEFQQSDQYGRGSIEEEDQLRLFELKASEEAIRLDYEAQHLDYQIGILEREIDSAGGIRPRNVQQANLLRGIALSLLGSLILGVHFVLCLWALDWLEIAWKAHAAAFGISICGAVGTALLLMGILKIFKRQTHDGHTLCITYAAAFILVASMVCSAGLGKFRAELAAMKINETSSPVIIEGESVEIADQSDAVSRFYQKNLPLLGLIFPLMAMLFDISSGILLHVGIDKIFTSRKALSMLKERDRINRQKVENATSRDTINNQPGKRIFEFREQQRINKEKTRRQKERQAYRSTPQFRNKKIAFGLVSFVLLLLMFLAFATRSWSDTVAGIDLSLSEKRPRVSGRNALEANKKAVEKIIQTLMASETFHVLGITADSRTDPWIILEARMSEKPGFFSEKLQRGRAVITASWRKTSQKLDLFAKNTDLLGFMEVAGELLSKSERKKVFVLSDAKNCTYELNLEKAPRKASYFMEKLSKIREFPDMRGVDVYWLGAGGPDTTAIHFAALERFWRGFIERSGAKLKCFTSLREVKQ